MSDSLWIAASTSRAWSALRGRGPSCPWGSSYLLAKPIDAAPASEAADTAARIAPALGASGSFGSIPKLQPRWPLGALHGGSCVSYRPERPSLGASYQKRFFGVGGSYGYGAFFRGDADAAAESNMGRQRLQQEETDQSTTNQEGLLRLKMPETLATLVAEGAFQKPIRRSGVSVYHHHLPEDPNRSLMFLSATTRQAFASAAAAATSMVQQRERGVAAQLILDGRGVKAYFDPEWPDLMVRLGVGVKPLALRRLAEQYATKARIFIDKRGVLLTIHGWDKRAVGTLTMELYKHLKANPYTAKGARIAFYPVNKKVSSKK